ncbi:MAG: hypothetical protein P9L99_14535 [Candidatus Lernaella stagnicola]|nr:hypothetical protein [Candidatus Lernaella stagnicola]
MRSWREKIIGVALLILIAALGKYFVLRNWQGDQPATPKPEKTPVTLNVPWIDIPLETMEGAVEFTLSKPRFKTVAERTAAFANAVIAPVITRDELVATTKNALIALFQQIDPARDRWLEVRVFLDGEAIADEFAAAIGVLNCDMEGFGDIPGGSPWEVNVRLIDRQERTKQGISDTLLTRILGTRATVEQVRTELLVEDLKEPNEDRLLHETAKRHKMGLAALRRLHAKHSRLYMADVTVRWDLK